MKQTFLRIGGLLALLLAISGCHSLGSNTSSSSGSAPGPAPTTAATRSFYMGFTPFEYDITQAAIDQSYAYIASDADIIAQHMDNGIPWNEALSDTYPYADNIMNDWSTRRSKTPAGKKVYVAVTPLNPTRDGMALYRNTSDNMPLVAPFDSYAAGFEFNNPDVETAYLNYCKRVIAYFNPDFFAFGIEVNLLRENTNQTDWNNYVAFHKYVYAHLKALYPNLPIFVTVSGMPLLYGYEGAPAEFSGDADPAGAFQASQQSALGDIIVDDDYFALSLYPWGTNYYDSSYPGSYPSSMLNDLFSQNHGKPIAIGETGFPAENTTAGGITYSGDTTSQRNYFSDLLQQANQRSFKFVIDFLPRDYDALCNYIDCTGTGGAWEHIGFFDASGNPRPALSLWQSYLSEPVQ